jgi:hypothetical protein
MIKGLGREREISFCFRFVEEIYREEGNEEEWK